MENSMESISAIIQAITENMKRLIIKMSAPVINIFF